MTAPPGTQNMQIRRFEPNPLRVSRGTSPPRYHVSTPVYPSRTRPAHAGSTTFTQGF